MSSTDPALTFLSLILHCSTRKSGNSSTDGGLDLAAHLFQFSIAQNTRYFIAIDIQGVREWSSLLVQFFNVNHRPFRRKVFLLNPDFPSDGICGSRCDGNNVLLEFIEEWYCKYDYVMLDWFGSIDHDLSPCSWFAFRSAHRNGFLNLARG